MGRHVNHHDVQDRMIIRNKILSNQRSGSLVERDPASLSIPEQEALVKERIASKIKSTPAPKPVATRFTAKI